MKNDTLKFVSTCIISTLLYAGTSAASPLENVYLKAGAGGMIYRKFKETGDDNDGYVKKAPKTSPVYNIGLGYRFCDSLRADLNLQYAKIKYKASDREIVNLRQSFTSIAGFFNGYYDIKLHDKIIPYLTAGIGVGHNKASDLKEDDILPRKAKNKTSFIWNVGGGVAYNLNKNYALDIAYRYVDLGTVTTKDIDIVCYGGRQSFRAHQLMGSIIYNF